MILDPLTNPIGLDSPIIITLATRLIDSATHPVLLVYSQHETLKYIARRYPEVWTRRTRFKAQHVLVRPPLRMRADVVFLAPIALKDSVDLAARYAHCSRSLFLFSPGDHVNV